MKSRICKFTFALLLVGMALPLAVNAQTETTCILSATSDVYVEIHDYAEERKEETTWSGNISSGGEQSVRARGGEILIEWRDLTEDNPRTQNRREICNGNTILVP